MAGLLDIFNNISPEQNQGLLAAAAHILQQSGPSRQPFTLGQAMGSGIAAYQGSMEHQRARQLAEQEAQQVAELRGYAIRDKKSDYEAQELQRQRARELETLRNSYFKPGGRPAPSMPAGKSADALFRGALAGQEVGPPQQAPAPAVAGGFDRGAMVQQRLAYAQYLRENGRGDAAQVEEDAALKLQPKVKGWEKVQVDGKVMFAPFFEDGSNGQPVPLEVAEKLDSINRGGSTDLVNPFTGATVRSIKNTLSPGEAASNALGWANHGLSKQRLEIERGEAATRAAAVKAPTEFQGKSGQFALRMGDSDQTIRELDGKYDPAAINTKASLENWPIIGGALGAAMNRFVLSEGDQKAEQAQRDWVNANLRQESGAAIGEGEFDNARKQYFPQPGDSQAVIEQKARNRQLAEQGMRANAGRAAMTAPPRTTTSDGWSIQRVD